MNDGAPRTDPRRVSIDENCEQVIDLRDDPAAPVITQPRPEVTDERSVAVDAASDVGGVGDAHPGSSARAGLLALAVLIAGIIVARMTGNLGALAVVGGILFLIMFHELGHFLAAKAFGMKATEFFVGFGPRIWSFRKGETEYGVRVVPLGGFVKVIGMSNVDEIDPADEPRTYRQKPFWQRIVLALAGPFMNFVLAFVLLWVAAITTGVPDGRGPVSVGSLVELQSGPSPAQIAGLKAGDRIVSINGQSVSSWSVAEHAFATSPNRELVVVVDRGGKSHTLTLTPMDRSQAKSTDGQAIPGLGTGQMEGFVGMSPSFKEGPIAAVGHSASRMVTGTANTLDAFGRIFSPAGVTQYVRNVSGTLPPEKQVQADQERFVSPVGLVNWSKKASDVGPSMALILLVSINVSVGLFNLIPLLPFDGGHAVVAAYGWVRSIGKRQRHVVDFRKLEPAMYAVVGTLIVISISAMWLDIVRPIGF